MESIRIYCSRCHREDTEAIIGEINKVCDEFGIKHGIAHLSSLANKMVKGKRPKETKWEEEEVARQVALRMLTMMTESHYCQACRRKTAEQERKESLRKKFKIVIGKKE